MRCAWNSRHAKVASWLIATVMPKMRPCHASSKTSSPFFLGSAAGPVMSAISRLGTGSIVASGSAGRGRRGPDDRHADHRVAGDERGQVDLAQTLGAGGPLRQDEIAELGARVPDADLGAVRQLDAELAQDHARLAHGARAVLEGLVPDGR